MLNGVIYLFPILFLSHFVEFTLESRRRHGRVQSHASHRSLYKQPSKVDRARPIQPVAILSFPVGGCSVL